MAVAMDNASWQGWDNEYNRAVYLEISTVTSMAGFENLYNILCLK